MTKKHLQIDVKGSTKDFPLARSKKKAELYNSPLIAELLNTINPIEAKKIEKEMIESASL